MRHSTFDRHLFLGLAVAAAFGAGPAARAQPGTPICQLPEYRGTAAYKRYCVGPARSGAPTAPAGPVYDPARSFRLLGVDVKGDFHVRKKDGRLLSAADLATVPLEFGDILETGPDSHARILLPDQTVFTIGSYGEMEVDSFVYDPATSRISDMAIAFTKGTLRFVTHIASSEPRSEPKVKIAVGTIGVRGTDIAFEQSPDGTGSIKLYSGLAELTPYDTDTIVQIPAGQMIVWTDFTKMSGPMPIN